MIPVLGVPILNKPELLYEMLASIDVEVGRLYVVDNGGVVDDERIAGDVYKPGRNLGVAASWNHIIASNPDAPWWAIVNFDLLFAQGDLQRLTDHMDSKGGVALLQSFVSFALDQDTFQRVGTFDENFHPAYFEDNDFDYRCRLAGVEMAGLPAGLLHRRSSTISDPRYALGNMRTFPVNQAYYLSKWGGHPYCETFLTPFDAGGDPQTWELDQARVEAQAWV